MNKYLRSEGFVHICLCVIYHPFPPPSVVVDVPSVKMFCSLFLNVVPDRVGVDEAVRNIP